MERILYLETMNGQKRNIKLHLAYWLVYFLINHLVFSPVLFGFYNLLITAFFVLSNAGTAYTTIDWWMPKLYKKRRYGLFLLTTLATVFVFAFFLGISLMGFFSLIYDSPVNLENIEQYSPGFYAAIFWSNFSAVTIIIIPYFILQRMEMERRNRQLEKEKLEAELKLLKSQLNPHFLFNALNNIYFLIKKDPDTAAAALAGFSNLLRFQLYEANNSFILLDKEIEYLKQYAEIAQLRKADSFILNWQLPEATKDIQIAPLLLMPLVENAFKHGSNKGGQVDIRIKQEKNQLQFYISNTKTLSKSIGINGFEEGGIGLTNVKKRLELIYPQKHNLEIKETDKEFIVDLRLSLNGKE